MGSEEAPQGPETWADARASALPRAPRPAGPSPVNSGVAPVVHERPSPQLPAADRPSPGGLLPQAPRDRPGGNPCPDGPLGGPPRGVLLRCGTGPAPSLRQIAGGEVDSVGEAQGRVDGRDVCRATQR